MFNPSRQEVRQFYIETWRKHVQNLPLTGAEIAAVAIILDHPEYHGILTQDEDLYSQDYPPELGNTNPFLHLSMHLALQEQLAIDQPVGIRQYYRKLQVKWGSDSAAQHEIIDCLGEMIWQAQRHHTPFDAAIYFNCLDNKLSA